MPRDDVFDSFSWHSSIGIDFALDGRKRFVSKMENTASNMAMFIAAGNDLLIHKTTRCLWKLSDDKKHIEPVFNNDVMTEEDVHAAMEE